MSDKIGLFTGSFDPVTNGHLDMIERASALFDRLYVGIFYNPKKTGYFTIDRRKNMLMDALKHLPNVEVISASDQLAVEVAKSYQVTHFVRGLRNAQDLAYESDLAYYNQQLAPSIETVFLLAKPDLMYVSSSRVRELLHFGADIRAFVPQSVLTEIEMENGNSGQK